MRDVKIKFLNGDAKMPYKKFETSFCYDVYATTDALPAYDDDGNVIDGVVRYGTGLSFEILRKEGEDLDLSDILIDLDFRARSGVYKTGLSLCNCTGTVDEEYRGEVMVNFYDIIPSLPKYKKGDRIAQFKIGKSERINFILSDDLSETDRGEGGFGHTGLA